MKFFSKICLISNIVFDNNEIKLLIMITLKNPQNENKYLQLIGRQDMTK